MLKVKWFGHSMWKIWNEDTTVVTDPFTDIGYKVPSEEKADIVMSSHAHFDHNNVSIIKGNPRIISTAGEFEAGKISIKTIPVWHDEEKGKQRGSNLLMKFRLSDLEFLHCGDLGHLPDDDVYSELGNVDVLFIPVGGFYTIDAPTALKIVKKLDPKITFPMHYKTPVLDFPIAGIDEYLKLIDDHLKIDSTEVEIGKYLTDQNTTIILNYE